MRGRGEDGERLLHDAKALEAAGAFSVVIEGVPAPLAAKITESLHISTIGIEAGPGCDAQVLVWQDMAGLSARSPKFAKRYADLAGVLRTAASEFAAEVRAASSPRRSAPSAALLDQVFGLVGLGCTARGTSPRLHRWRRACCWGCMF